MHDYMKKSIEAITDSKVLDKKDEKIIVDLQDTLDESHEKNQYFRPETEMNHSVLSKFLTVPAKYFQCVREMSVMISTLSANSFELIQAQGEMELAQIELSELGNTPKDNARKKIKKAYILSKELSILGLKHQAHYRAKEIKHWNRIMEKLLKEEKFDSSDVEKHQKESYKKRWSNEIAKGKNQYNNSVNLASLKSD